MLPVPLPPDTSVAEEMQKWRLAREFYNKTGHVDIAYDGVFLLQLAHEFCETLRLTAPDWIFLDDEGYGEGWGEWRFEVVQSANAQRRRLPFDPAWEHEKTDAWLFVKHFPLWLM